MSRKLVNPYQDPTKSVQGALQLVRPCHDKTASVRTAARAVFNFGRNVAFGRGRDYARQMANLRGTGRTRQQADAGQELRGIQENIRGRIAKPTASSQPAMDGSRIRGLEQQISAAPSAQSQRALEQARDLDAQIRRAQRSGASQDQIAGLTRQRNDLLDQVGQDPSANRLLIDRTGNAIKELDHQRRGLVGSLLLGEHNFATTRQLMRQRFDQGGIFGRGGLIHSQVVPRVGWTDEIAEGWNRGRGFGRLTGALGKAMPAGGTVPLMMAPGLYFGYKQTKEDMEAGKSGAIPGTLGSYAASYALSPLGIAGMLGGGMAGDSIARGVTKPFREASNFARNLDRPSQEGHHAAHAVRRPSHEETQYLRHNHLVRPQAASHSQHGHGVQHHQTSQRAPSPNHSWQ